MAPLDLLVAGDWSPLPFFREASYANYGMRAPLSCITRLAGCSCADAIDHEFALRSWLKTSSRGREGGTRMREEQDRFLGLLGSPPARLTAEQTAWALNCATHDVPILVAARLLRPLGNPAANGVKYFSTMDVLGAAKDRSWLAKMTNALSSHWKKKNSLKQSHATIAPFAAAGR